MKIFVSFLLLKIVVARERLYKPVPSPIPVLENRFDIPVLFENEKMLRGAELGVLHGVYARDSLRVWPSAVEYVLVDLWAPQEHYVDIANAPQEEHDDRMQAALYNTKPWDTIVKICRDSTINCSKSFQDDYFDTLYIDARHDRKGVLEDLEAWWPKVRADGLVCGHDFVKQDEGPEQTGQDWTKNYDGSVDTTRRAVRGAVEDFAHRQKRQIQVTYREPDWPSWCIRR